MSKVKKVLHGDNKTSGSVVELLYGSILHNAEIISVDDDPTILDRRLLEYTTDPKNAHRFPPKDGQELSVQKKKAKGKAKTKTNKKGKPSGQKEPKGKKPKEQATVVVRIDPAVSRTPSTPSSNHDTSLSDLDTSLPDPNPPASPSVQSLSVPSSPVLPPDSPLPATSTQDSLLDSFQSRSPSISILATQSTPRQPPALPKRLSYPATSTSLYSDWSEASHDQYSPRFTHSERYNYSTPTNRHSRQSSPFRSRWRQTTASPEWNSYQRPGGSPYEKSFVSYRQDVDYAEIRQTLRRLERKVDHLTQLLEKPSSRPASYMYIPAARQHQTMEMSMPASNLPLSMEEEDQGLLADNQDGLSKKESLLAIRARASSSMNFSVRLLREFFQPGELKGKNVSGMRGKEQLDPAKILKIKNYVYEFYPTPPSERDCVWRECRKAIDLYLRKTFRSS
ncbi:hypothetical protein ACROYT_G026865 [Oculina patagonica]